LDALDEEIPFHERIDIDLDLPYDDMQSDARYTSYVLYATREGMLRGFGERKGGKVNLKALTPIYHSQLQQLLYNAGIEKNYRNQMGV